jgi:hypothetical protein
MGSSNGQKYSHGAKKRLYGCRTENQLYEFGVIYD